MKKRILILYATYGSGHKSVGEYIKNYFESTGAYECLALDLISYSMPILGTFSKKSSEFFMTKFPGLWSLLYFAFDNKISGYISSNISPKMFNNKVLKNTIKDFNPDITIATHFYGTDLICNYNKKEITNSKVITVVTDYKAHDFWLNKNKNIDAIIVSSFEERLHLLKKGYKNKQIHTTGIPILPKIVSSSKKETLKKKYKIDNKKKTVLFFAGGGKGSSFNLIYLKEILKNKYNCNILFIAGKNKNAEKLARDYAEKYSNKSVQVYGFVTNVNEFYQVSDFVITKPGGAQVTECLYFEKPMLLIKSNGGQEIENRRFLVTKGYAKSVRSIFSFNRNFKEMLRNDALRKRMQNNIRKIDAQKSMENLYKIVEKL